MTTAAWPTEIWTHQGVKPFANPDPKRRFESSLGFLPGDEFTGATKARITEGADVAQIVDSNLFKVAAGAVGVDWTKFRAQLVAKDDMQAAMRKRVFVKDSKDGKTKWINRRKWEEDQDVGRYTARFSKTDEFGKKIDYGNSRVSVEDGDDYQDWGKTDSGEQIEITDDEKESLDKMQDWLKSNEEQASRSGSDIWDTPPSGHDYGFDNDNLWEALGIDPSKPPPPAPFLNDPETGKPLDFLGKYIAPRRSHVTIPVPEGYANDHPGIRPGSFINTVAASQVASRTDLTHIPVVGHEWPGSANPGPGTSPDGVTTPINELQYRD